MNPIQVRFDELLAARWRAGYTNSDPNTRGRLWDQAVADVKADVKASRRFTSAKERAERDRLQRALPLMGARERAAAYTAIVESLAREQNTAVEWRWPREMPPGTAAYADWSRRQIVVPRIDGDVEARFAVSLHELGHIVAGPCSGGDHQRDARETRWHKCLRCETLAWEHAMRLWPFTADMFTRLRSSLGIYLHSTPGPASAIDALERQRGTVTLADSQLAWRRFQDRVVWLERAKGEVRTYAKG